MKNLRKFNESKDGLDIEYLNLIFSDFIDDDGAQVDSSHSKKVWAIFIREPKLYKEYNSIEENIKAIEEFKEYFLDIKTCIDRVKDEYPNVFITYSPNMYYDRISISFSLK